MAHDRPERVRALIAALDDPRITVHLHVAANSAYALDRFLPEDAERVVVVEPRRSVQWGTMSLVDALVTTMRAVHATRPDYISLISGACWPTKSPAEIVDRLCGSGKAGFLAVEPLSEGSWNRLDQYHLVMRKLPGVIGRTYTRVRIRVPRRDRSRVPPAYGGSTWMDLRDDVVGWLLERIDEDPGYRRAYRWTHLTDEVFFHTLLMDSPYRDELVPITD